VPLLLGEWKRAGLYRVSLQRCRNYRTINSLQALHFMDHFFHLGDLNRKRASKGKLYLEFLRVPAMSAGVYVLPKGGIDPCKSGRSIQRYMQVR